MKEKLYTSDMISAVKDFNARLKKGGVSTQFSESNISSWLPKLDGRKIYQESFLVCDDKSAVRGMYILKHQDFCFNGKTLSIGNYQLPLSEGIVNKAYGLVGLQLLFGAIKRQPLIYGLGMGGYDQPSPKLMRAAGWSLCVVPFYFKVNKPVQFLKNITYLRRKRAVSFLMDLVAVSGLGWAGLKTLQFFFKKKNQKKNSDYVVAVNTFSSWSDDLWSECSNKYSMTAVRDSITLNILYPPEDRRFHRLKVLEEDMVIGWAVVLDTQMFQHKQFGDMRVGSIIDCLALPENAYRIMKSASDFLEKRGVDIIVSNQLHSSWCRALRDAGFIKGPSNFIFAASKKLSELLHPFSIRKSDIHVNRGDADGPINL